MSQSKLNQRHPQPTTMKAKGKIGERGDAVCSSASSLEEAKQMKTKMKYEDDKKSVVVDIMNVAAKKMLDLKAVLVKEAVISREEVDAACLEAVATRLYQQMQIVDAVKNPQKGLNSLSREKTEMYHYYFEELQDYCFGIGKSDLDELFNKTCDSLDVDSSGIPVNNSSRGLLKPVSKDCLNTRKHEETGNADEGKPLNANKDSKPIPVSISSAGDEDSRENRAPNIKHGMKFSSESSVLPGSIQKRYLGGCERFDEVRGEAGGSSSSLASSTCNFSRKLTSSSRGQISKSRYYMKGDFGNFSSSDEASCFDFQDEDVADAHKCKVVRKKPYARLRVQDVFPAIQEKQVHSPKITASSPNFNQSADLNLSTHGSPWANKSKSANESWYEFKERCSATSLQQQLVQRESPARQTPSSKFSLKDYIRGTSPSPQNKPVKSVRFNISSRGRPEYSDSESSSEDELRFDVKQFPCRETRLPRSKGYSKLRRFSNN